MRITRYVVTTLLVSVAVLRALPAMASSDWVDDFLRRYQPSLSAEASSAPRPQPAGQLFPTGTVQVALSDVINMMIENNLDIRSNRLSPRSSYFQGLVFYRALHPSVRFSGTVGRNTQASTNQINGAAISSQLRGTYTAGFSQLLPTGTSLAVDAVMGRLSSNNNLSTYNPAYTGTLTYSVGQHLLRDRGRVSTMRQILIGSNNEKISETQFEFQVTNLIAQAQKSYWDLVFAGEDLKVKQRSLDLAQQTLDENKLKVEIGTLAPIDVVQTQSDVASRREQFVVSTYNVTSAEDQIKKLTSSDKDPSMFLTKLQASESPRNPENVDIPALQEAVRTALENRPEMRQANLDLDNKHLDVNYTANQKLPILDVTATYNQNGTGGTQTVRGTTLGSGQILKIVPGGIFDAFGQLFGYGYTGYTLGFSLTIPLNNKAADADYSRALTEQRLSQSKLDVTAQQIALDVRNALTQVEMNRARIETAKTTRELAAQKLDAEQTKFNLGTSTLRFVLKNNATSHRPRRTRSSRS